MIAEMAPVPLLECSIHALTMDQTVARALAWVDARDRERQIVTVNAAILVMMRKDETLREAVAAADMIVSDGTSVLWASRLLRRPIPERIAGVDLMSVLLEAANQHGLRVFYLGATREVLDRLVEVTQAKYPGMTLAGHRDGYFGPDEWHAVIREIRDSRADILFVGMPTPFKEVWCQEHLQEFGVPVVLGVGGSFDVLCGMVRRAPKWMQSAGLEWSWRVLMEPRRLWKRYLVTNTLFIGMVLSEMIRTRFGLRGEGA